MPMPPTPFNASAHTRIEPGACLSGGKHAFPHDTVASRTQAMDAELLASSASTTVGADEAAGEDDGARVAADSILHRVRLGR